MKQVLSDKPAIISYKAQKLFDKQFGRSVHLQLQGYMYATGKVQMVRHGLPTTHLEEGTIVHCNDYSGADRVN